MLECIRHVMQFLKYESPSGEQTKNMRVRETGNTRGCFVFSTSVEWDTNRCDHSSHLRFTKQCRGHIGLLT
jgi:hypothetical protein